MIVSEAVREVLEALEQTSEEEYGEPQAQRHVAQAIRELSETQEFKFQNALTSYTLVTPAAGSESTEWTEAPGQKSDDCCRHHVGKIRIHTKSVAQCGRYSVPVSGARPSRAFGRVW